MFDFKAESEIIEIEGVIQIKITVPFALKYVSLYLFKVAGNYVLIDAGLNMLEWSKIFFSALEEIGITLSDVHTCILTHRHMDHIGLIKKFKRINPDLQILMHEITHENIKWESNRNNHKEIDRLARESVKLMIKYGISDDEVGHLSTMMSSWAKMAVYQAPDRILKDGDEIAFKTNKLKIIWTPGHALGHICIFDQNKRYLFSGDHILSRITPHIGNFIINPNLSDEHDFTNILKHYLNSLDVINDLNSKIIFPAHQDVIYNPHERILEIKKHHDTRLTEILKMIEGNPMTPRQISLKHFGELDQMNSYLGLSEILGHLIYLEAEDKVSRIEQDGKYLFAS